MAINISKTPDKPGVYILKDNRGLTLYVGKASSLKKRLRSYLKPGEDLRINRLIAKLISYETYEVNSEIEALILEANLIKKFKPEYNIQLRDDKDYLYIKITKEDFPKVLSARKRSISDARVYFGPFPSSRAVRSTLKTIRRIFPYSSCKPNVGKACLQYHLGLCPGVCIGKISKSNYKKDINNIRLFLLGEKGTVVGNLKKEMGKASSELRYEEAAKIYESIKYLEYVLQHKNDIDKYTDDPEFLKKYRQTELKVLKDALDLNKTPKRIEGYDISNIQGQFATGSMVVFTDGEADKSEYRKFKIKKVSKISDTDMMEEILRRRFKNEWKQPDLIIVDGGKGQLSACLTVLRELNLKISCAALAKRLEQIYLPEREKPIRFAANSKALHIVQRIRDEAHRFAIKYHRHLRSKSVLTAPRSNVSLTK